VKGEGGLGPMKNQNPGKCISYFVVQTARKIISSAEPGIVPSFQNIARNLDI